MPLLRDRGSGHTTRQMVAAPKGAVFVWVNSHLQYPRDLKYFLGREDLILVSPDWLVDERWRGNEYSGIVIDHATRLNYRQREGLLGALLRVKKSRTKELK